VPVYEEKPEEIVGILHARRALALLDQGELSLARLKSALAGPYFIPSGTPVLTQLQHFRDNQRRLGLVVDEYGELLGLVTVEDILEEIIGEFAGATSGAAQECVREKDGSVLVKGSALLRDLNRRLGLNLPLDGARTLNGLILEHLQEIPEGETSLRIAGYAMEIVRTRGRAIHLVRILPPAERVEG
jgi:Mg2+/Co2+ transporter CorB